MTAAVPLVERLAEVLGGHRGCFRLQRRGGLLEFDCGIEVPLDSPSPEAAHVARALLPVVEQAVAEAEESARTAWAVHAEHVETMNRLRLHDMAVAEERQTAAVTEARGEALREAAKEAEERGDIGKVGGIEAWEWLRIRADRIGGAE